MNTLRSIIFASALSGLLAGLVVTGIQIFGTTPLILQAEAYEAAEPATSEVGHQHDVEHQHDAVAVDHHSAVEHSHDEKAWAPADGAERFFYTAGANILIGIGFAIVLTALMSLRGRPVSAREGIVWGLAAFASVMLMPSIGLPPELPGSAAGPLLARQTWWIVTALATAGGIVLSLFRREWWAYIAASALIVAPHLIGAPQPAAGEVSLAPAALEQRFILVALGTSLVFWLLLGPLSAIFLGRLRDQHHA